MFNVIVFCAREVGQAGEGGEEGIGKRSLIGTVVLLLLVIVVVSSGKSLLLSSVLFLSFVFVMMLLAIVLPAVCLAAYFRVCTCLFFFLVRSLVIAVLMVFLVILFV